MLWLLNRKYVFGIIQEGAYAFSAMGNRKVGNIFSLVVVSANGFYCSSWLIVLLRMCQWIGSLLKAGDLLCFRVKILKLARENSVFVL